MPYLHVSLVHSARTSSGLPEAAGCFPRAYSHAGRGEKEACTLGPHRVPLSRCEAPGSPPRGPRQPAGCRELSSARGAESAHRRARGAGEEPGGHALPQARVLFSGVSKTLSFSAELFLASCPAASCLSHSSPRASSSPALT